MRKVYWCLNVLEEGENWKKPIPAMQALIGDKEAEVVPTYVVGHELLHWISNMTPSLPKDLVPHMAEKMDEKLKEVSVQGLGEKLVVLGQGSSNRADAKALLKVLDDNSAELCVVNTKARTGIPRLFMGSFAEALLYDAKLPILFVSPNTQMAGDSFKKTFFATDFSGPSEEVFNELLNFRFRVGENLVLYSKVAYPVNAVAQTMTSHLGGGWISIDQYMKDYLAKCHEKAEQWKAAAEQKGFQVDVIVDDAPGDLVTDILRASANAESDLIVMGAKVSASEHFFFGSTTREVIRHSEVPVLAWHPKVSD